MLRESGTLRRQPSLWRRCRSLRQIKQVHALMVLRGFLTDPSALRELIFASAVAVRGGLAHARLVIDRIPHPDRFMSNTLIRGAAHSDAPRDAVSIYARMARRRGDCGGGSGVTPDRLTFPFVLRACAAMGAGGTGAQVHAHVVKAGCESDAFVRNALIASSACTRAAGILASRLRCLTEEHAGSRGRRSMVGNDLRLRKERGYWCRPGAVRREPREGPSVLERDDPSLCQAGREWPWRGNCSTRFLIVMLYHGTPRFLGM
ncbi:unnamed protein product [Urochloa humidicola]